MCVINTTSIYFQLTIYRELSPGSLRTFVVGTSYQLGNLASSASSTIEATIGERFPLPPLVNAKTGKVTKRYEYGIVMCIFLGCVFGYVIILTFIGPERLGRNLDVAHDSDMAEVTHRDLRHAEAPHGNEYESDEKRAEARKIEDVA